MFRLHPRAWRQMFPFPHWEGGRKPRIPFHSFLAQMCLTASLLASSRKLFNYFSSAANVVRKNARPKFKLRGKISTVADAAADLLTLPSPRRRSAIMMMGGALLWHTNAGEELLNAHEHSWPGPISTGIFFPLGNSKLVTPRKRSITQLRRVLEQYLPRAKF